MEQYNFGMPQIPVNEDEPQEPVLTENDEVLEMGEDFDFAGFQVVRREFFAHTREPSVSFCNCRFYVNTACLSKFPTSDYAQVLINRKNKILALRPCPEGARDAFRWCKISKKDGKRQPRPITCKLFFAKMVSLMEWDPNHRYKILGNIIHSNDEFLLAFDLSATEVYQRTSLEDERHRTSRVPVFPAEWQDQFGLPFEEHQRSMKINIVDNYAIYSIKDTNSGSEKEEEKVEQETQQTEYAALPSPNMFGGENV